MFTFSSSGSPHSNNTRDTMDEKSIERIEALFTPGHFADYNLYDWFYETDAV